MSAKALRTGYLSALFTTVTIVALTFAISSTGTAENSAKPAARTSARRHTKTKKHHKAAKVSELQLLPFQKVVLLNFRQRVRYIHLLRQIALQAERNQIAFHSEKAAAFNDNYNDRNLLEEQRKLFAVLFSPEAYADASGGKCDYNGNDERGKVQSDCGIIGFNIVAYKNGGNGKQHPGDLDVSKVRCPGGGGILCNPTISGIPSDNPAGCLPDDQLWDSTNQCFLRMNALAKDPKNAADAAQAVIDAKNFFNLDGTCQTPSPFCQKITLARATSPEAGKIIQNLWEHAYADGDWAELAEVIAFYQFNHIEPKGIGGNFSKVFENLNFTQFASKFNAAEEAVKQIFAGYDRLCSQRLGGDVTDAISKYGTPQQDKNINYPQSQHFKQRENYRKQLVAEGKAPTNRDVLQDRECTAIANRENNLKAAASNIATTIPIVLTQGPQQVVPVPIVVKPQTPTSSYRMTGCSTNVYQNDYELFQNSTQCSVCLSENAADQYVQSYLNNPNATTDQKQMAQKLNGYVDSTRWKAFLTTMAMACGDSDSAATRINTDTMNRYVETFGQCSKDDYDWPADSSFGSPDDPNSTAHFIQSLSTNGFAENQADYQGKSLKQKLAYINDKFKTAFGARFTDVLRMFCHPGRVKHRWLWVGTKFDTSVNSENMSAVDFKAMGRKSFNPSAVRRLFRDDGSTPRSQRPPLENCMLDAINNADHLYPDGKECLPTVTAHSYADLINVPKAAINAGGAASISDIGQCWVSKFQEKYGPLKGADGGKVYNEGIAYSLPSQVSSQDAGQGFDPNAKPMAHYNETALLELNHVGGRTLVNHSTYPSYQNCPANCDPTSSAYAPSSDCPPPVECTPSRFNLYFGQGGVSITYNSPSCLNPTAAAANQQNSSGSSR